MDWYEGRTDGSDDGIDDENGGESDVEEESFVDIEEVNMRLVLGFDIWTRSQRG